MARVIRAMIILIFTLVPARNQAACMAAFHRSFPWPCPSVFPLHETWLTAEHRLNEFKSIFIIFVVLVYILLLLISIKITNLG